MEKADTLLGPLIRQLGIEPAVRLARLRTSWDGIFAEPLVSHTYPASLSEGELLINVDHPAYLQQFVFLQREILAKLRSFGVTGVRFRIGRVVKKTAKHAPKSPAVSLGASDREFVESLAGAVQDEDLQAAVRQAATRSLIASTKKKKAGR